MTFLWSRYFIFQTVLLLSAASAALAYYLHPAWAWSFALLGPLLLLGLYDQLQTRHSILRNYPIIGHIRFILEAIRPELRQYLMEDERDPVPFSREQRTLVYRRAKDAGDAQPFGTVLDVGAVG